jgi:F0F1-type ATP synthase membrane subunit c/vacuolar-type H+-ATPase subunit K
MSRNVALIIIFVASILGPSAVFALASFASIQALGRNPSSAPKIFTGLVLSLLFAQALAITAMLIAFQLFSAQ